MVARKTKFAGDSTPSQYETMKAICGKIAKRMNTIERIDQKIASEVSSCDFLIFHKTKTIMNAAPAINKTRRPIAIIYTFFLNHWTSMMETNTRII